MRKSIKIAIGVCFGIILFCASCILGTGMFGGILDAWIKFGT
jgi:hypothetical protein